MHITEEQPEKALLVTAEDSGGKDGGTPRKADELASLAGTMGCRILGSIIVTLRKRSPATFLGRGKVEEIAEKLDEVEADLVIFNNSISPRVQRNLESLWGIPVIDREEVILEIFARSARTREAKLQVELARLEYSRPRLARMWTQLAQQRGGAFRSRGSGETQLELDQRRISERITQLKRELSVVAKERSVQRQGRMQSPVPRGAIVGYTNSGKSSLLNCLSGSNVLAEDKLFATLDPTTRLAKLPGGEEILLTDTVGFVSDLPTALVDAFRSTLEEALYADFLLIVCDMSHPAVLSCWDTTQSVLEDLGCAGKPTVILCNKTDLPHDESAVARLKALGHPLVEGSVKTGEGIEELKEVIAHEIHRLSPTLSLLIPEERYDLVTRLRREAQIIRIAYTGEGVRVTARVKNPALAAALGPYLVT